MVINLACMSWINATKTVDSMEFVLRRKPTPSPSAIQLSNSPNVHDLNFRPLTLGFCLVPSISMPLVLVDNYHPPPEVFLKKHIKKMHIFKLKISPAPWNSTLRFYRFYPFKTLGGMDPPTKRRNAWISKVLFHAWYCPP